MSSKQKQRKAAERAKYEAYLERRSEKARRQRRNQFIIAGVVVAVIVGGVALWMSGIFDGDTDATADPSSQPTSEPLQFKKPKQVLTKGEPATATMVTDQGDITIELDTAKAPKNSNSLAFLGQQGYYDYTACHRLTTGDPLYVLQCGDTAGDGTSSPGYTTDDENLPKSGDGDYPAGTLAMAEDQSGKPGGQFFIVYKDSTLPPDFTIVGRVTDGLDIVKSIAKDGVSDGSTDGAPATPITLEAFVVEQA